MTLEHFETLPSLEVPAPDGEVSGAGEQYLSGGIERHARDRSGVFFERHQRFGSLERPGDRSAVGRSRHQNVPVALPLLILLRVAFALVFVVGRRNKDERIHAALMSTKHAQTFTALEVPAARRAVVWAAEDEVAGADDTIDDVLVAFQHRHATARRHVPLANRLVGAAADDERVLDQDAVDSWRRSVRPVDARPR